MLPQSPSRLAGGPSSPPLSSLADPIVLLRSRHCPPRSSSRGFCSAQAPLRLAIRPERSHNRRPQGSSMYIPDHTPGALYIQRGSGFFRLTTAGAFYAVHVAEPLLSTYVQGLWFRDSDVSRLERWALHHPRPQASSTRIPTLFRVQASGGEVRK